MDFRSQICKDTQQIAKKILQPVQFPPIAGEKAVNYSLKISCLKARGFEYIIKKYVYCSRFSNCAQSLYLYG
jgi:hypothetical protein